MTVQEIINKLQLVEDKSINIVFTTPDGFIDIEQVNYCEWGNVIVVSDN